MQPIINRAKPEELPIVQNLLQFHLHEVSAFKGTHPDLDHNGLDLDDQGRFPSETEKHLLDGTYKPYLIRANDKVVGFALLFHAATHQHSLVEFFLLKKYRRRGIGTRIAKTIFSMFDGLWDLNYTDENVVARTFWHKIVHEYTKGHFSSIPIQKGCWKGTTIRFASSPCVKS